MKKIKENRNNVLRHLIDYFKVSEGVVSKQEIDESWNKLKQQMYKEEQLSKRNHFLLLSISTSAIAAALLGIIWFNAYINYKESRIFDSFIAQIDTTSLLNSDEILLMVDDKKPIHINKGALVTYSQNGTLLIDEKSVTKEANKSEESEYNQLIVPKGKHTRLLLSDGSELHVNAGTKVVYPRRFKGNKREIYVDGEIYIDVVHNAEKPFIVNTSSFKVEVLGTAFNINAYKEMSQAEVMLVRGAVTVWGVNDGTTTQMRPNELTQIESGKVTEKKWVDPADYIAWMNGVLPLDNKDIAMVFHKLSVFYGEKIQYDPAIKPLSLKGTIDLSVPLPKVLERISKLIPITYERTGESYYLRMKENVKPLK